MTCVTRHQFTHQTQPSLSPSPPTHMRTTGTHTDVKKARDKQGMENKHGGWCIHPPAEKVSLKFLIIFY